MAQASLEDVNCSIAKESAQQDGKTSETVPFTAKVSSDQHSNILELTRMRPELVTALGLPTTFLAADPVWPISINYDIKYADVKDMLDKLVRSINLNRLPRDEACKAIVDHFLHVYPKYNVMIVFSQHLQHFDEGCLHFHIELKPFILGTVGYEIYVFKHGWFTLLGDGGYDNWCFGGNFKRDGKSVQFFDP